MKPLGIRAKVTLFYTALFALILVGLSVLFYRTLGQRLERELDAELTQTSAGLRGYLDFHNGKPALVFNPDDPQEAYFIRTATRYFQVYDGVTLNLVEQSRELELIGLVISQEELRRQIEKPQYLDVESGGVGLRIHNYVIRSPRKHPYLVQVGASRAGLENALLAFRNTMFLLVPAGLLVAGLGGYVMGRRVLAPVDALTRLAQEINISKLDRRLPVRGTGDELDRLAETFNQVFARLEAAVEQMRQFTGNVSHELRTPLTALRGEAEVMLLRERPVEDYRRVLASQLEEFDKLTHLINELLILARADAGEIRLDMKDLDLGPVVRGVVEQMEPVAAWKGVKLQIGPENGEGPVPVRGDEQWIERIVVNLVDNAIKFTPRGGQVEVQVGRRNQEARLEVRDTGIGIVPEALPHIFERFYRADQSRSKKIEGAGLGLSLVEWIAQAHHGRVTAVSTIEKGSCFTVVLPSM